MKEDEHKKLKKEIQKDFASVTGKKIEDDKEDTQKDKIDAEKSNDEQQKTKKEEKE